MPCRCNNNWCGNHTRRKRISSFGFRDDIETRHCKQEDKTRCQVQTRRRQCALLSLVQGSRFRATSDAQYPRLIRDQSWRIDYPQDSPRSVDPGKTDRGSVVRSVGPPCTGVSTYGRRDPEQQLSEHSEEGIGGTFQYRSYENAELVSSKQLTTFSDHRFPLSAPDHISLPQYVEYLQAYVDRFALGPRIKLGCPVTSITPLEKTPDSKWRHRVKYVDRKNDSKERTLDCSHVAICTGLHVEPNVPSIPGIQNLRGEAIHSSQYKGRAQLTGQDVLIMGCGETGMGTEIPND